MDWPVIGAITGVTVLGAAVTVGAIAMVRSTPEPAKKTAVMAPLLRFESRPEVGIINGPELPGLTPSNFGKLPPRPPPAPPAKAAPAAPAAKNPPPPTAARPGPALAALAPAERNYGMAHGPVAPRPLAPDPRFEAPRPHFEAPKVDRRYDGVMTLAEISRIKASMRLTPAQEPQWHPVESVLRDIGRQQTALVHAGRKPEVDSAVVQRLYLAARPLLAMLRPDQKEQVRRLARSLGYESVAAMI